MNNYSDFEIEIKEKIVGVEEIIFSYAPAQEGEASLLYEAMNYSLLAGGKRMRPLLMQEMAQLFGGAPENLLHPMMAAIEMIHTYSLIHDDLPAIDNDDYRRGRKTCHVVYGEDMAILAGDGLQSYAYELAAAAMSEAGTFEDMKKMAEAMKLLTVLPGIRGMIAGQTVDVHMSGKELTPELLRYVFMNKTAAMIKASMQIGAVLAGAGDDETEKTGEAAWRIGVAFQIIDDILDETGDPEQLGKPVGSDEKNKKTTWVTVRGLDGAAEDASKLSEEAIEIIRGLKAGAEGSFILKYIKWLLERRY